MKRACSNEQIIERKLEIIKTVSKMFDLMDYQDISMKTISENISIARSSLYCYYNNKEEIMLDVLKEDYLKFVNELIVVFSNQKDDETLIDELTNIYLSHIKLMKIVSLYLSDIEIHASLDKLVEFKASFVEVFKTLKDKISLFFDNNLSQSFFDALIMLTHSLYPMIYPNENQKKAMIKVGMKFNEDGYKYCYNYFLILIKGMKNENK